VRRTVAEFVALLADRERTRDGQPRAHVFLVVDGWSTLRSDFDELEPTLTELATRGLAYGIHVVAAAMRWNDFRPSIRDLFGTRLELRLGEASDSDVDRRLAAAVPRVPGRGLTADRHHFLAARPVLGAGDADGLVGAIAAAWNGPPAPPVRLLPELVPYERLAAEAPLDGGDRLVLPIGIAEDDLRPVCVDLGGEPHLLLFGDSGCGKTSFLRALAATITGRFAPEEARVMLGRLPARPARRDHRRPSDRVRHRRRARRPSCWSRRGLHAAAAARPAGHARRAARPLVVDRPGTVRARRRLRPGEHRPGQPAAPLLDFLAQARDVGLHVVLARRPAAPPRHVRTGDPAHPGTVRPAIVMSGDRDEGVLVGNVRPGPLPPGRGRLITRRDGVRLVQLAYLPVQP
jgi:S-DNA-T family DNA segregation ATPase FtsK/SpoIIIE